MFITSVVVRDSLEEPYHIQSISTTNTTKNKKLVVISETNSPIIHHISKSWYCIQPLSPSGRLYRFWELLGIFLTVSILFDIFVIRLHTNDHDDNHHLSGSNSNRHSNSNLKNNWTYLTHPLADLYFIVDMIIRFHTEYIDEVTGEVVSDLKRIRYHYLTSWFLFDLILSLPYGFIRHCWESRPALKLLAIKERSHRSVVKFFTSKEFRKDLFQTIKAHIRERNFWIKFISNETIIPTAKQSRMRKAARISTSWYRALINFRVLKTYSSIVKSFISFAMSIRTLSLLSTSKRRM